MLIYLRCRLKNWLRRLGQGSLLLPSIKVGHLGEFILLIFHSASAFFSTQNQTADINSHLLCSISNLGMFPVDHFCAIINPPQVPLCPSVLCLCLFIVCFGEYLVINCLDPDMHVKPNLRCLLIDTFYLLRSKYLWDE